MYVGGTWVGDETTAVGAVGSGAAPGVAGEVTVVGAELMIRCQSEGKSCDC